MSIHSPSLSTFHLFARLFDSDMGIRSSTASLRTLSICIPWMHYPMERVSLLPSRKKSKQGVTSFFACNSARLFVPWKIPRKQKKKKEEDTGMQRDTLDIHTCITNIVSSSTDCYLNSNLDTIFFSIFVFDSRCISYFLQILINNSNK